jgi:hypothetical protein
MAAAKKCDRCGKFYEKNFRQIYVVKDKGLCSTKMDLCDECQKELIDWVEKKNENEQSRNTQIED